MNNTNVREEQLRIGRELSALDGIANSNTIKLKKEPYGSTRFDSKRASSKSIPKGHEAFLKALESSGAIVSFEKISSGIVIQGVIKHSDKFTVSVISGNTTRVLFKHDISEFWAVPRDDKAV